MIFNILQLRRYKICYATILLLLIFLPSWTLADPMPLFVAIVALIVWFRFASLLLLALVTSLLIT